LNLVGVILPGPKIPAVPTNFLILKDGVVVRTVLRKQPEGMSDVPVSVVRRMSDR
jgi:ATP-dependent Lhr-like helicase